MSGPTYSYNQGAVQSSYTAFIAYDFTVPTTIPVGYSGLLYTLFWPIAFQNSPNIVANFNKCTGSNLRIQDINGFILPDATQVSVGTNFQIQNTTNQNISVYTQNSNLSTNLIATVLPTQVVEFLLTDTSSVQGTYSVFIFGIGTSAVIAANLAGEGLIATPDNKLNEDINITTIPLATGEITIDEESRASFYLVQPNAGSVQFVLPDPGSVENGFFFSLTNLGNGSITFNFGTSLPTPTLDNGNTTFIEPGRSASIITDGTNWFSLGLGNASSVLQVPVQVNLSSAVGGTYTLSPTQYNNQIIQFVGTLPTNVVVSFPSAAGIWYVENSTTPNGHTLALTLLGSMQTPVPFPAGETLIVVSDGTTLSNYPSIITPSAGYFGAGSAAAPSISFTDNVQTGAYLSGGQNFAITQNGNEVVEFSHTSGGTPTSNLIFPVTLNVLVGAISVFNSSINGIQINVDGTANLPSLSWGVGLGWFKSAVNIVRLSANSIPLLEANGTSSTITVLQNFQVDGTSVFNGAITITGGFIITGDLTITGNVGITGNLNVTQDVTCNQILPTQPVAIEGGGTGQQQADAAAGALLEYTTRGQMNYCSATGNPGLGNVIAAPTKSGIPLTSIPSNGFIPSWIGNSVLQVIQQSITSGTIAFADGSPIAALSVSITPKYNNSKIFLQFSGTQIRGDTNSGWLIIKRNATAITGYNPDITFANTALTGVTFSPITFSYLDSPATTAACTYTFYMKTTGVGDPANISWEGITLLAFEVGGF